MKLTREEQEVLLSAHEVSDLWEVAAALANLPGYADRQLAQSKAAEIVAELGARGWLAPYREKITGDRRSGSREKLPISELAGLLRDDLNWSVPRDRPEHEFYQYGIAPTTETDDLVEQGAVNDAWPHRVQR